ncbi:uncharacterized protein CBL_09837 [Carabus blaptoides fortunei]
MDSTGDRCYRPLAFDKMEGLVREMQDPENGVPVRSQKLFLTSIPSAFMGYDLIEWLMERLGIEESEALNIANQMCQYGYFFPVSDSKNLVVKDDSSLYRFQSPYYWPWQQRTPDNVEYAIYLAKRTLRNKQRHGLEEYELEALNNLRKNLQNKWDFITLQAEEQVKLAKERKKGDKIVSDSQERAYWRVYRPPPGFVSSLEQCPVPNRNRNGSRQRRRTLEDCRREVDLLKNSLSRTRIKVSQALESMVQYVETYAEYDPLITGTQPSNPWVSEDLTYWQLNNPLVELPTEKRVRRWGLSMEECVSDPTGLNEFTAYLRKEYSHENIRFWMAVNDLRRSSQSQIQRKVSEIFEEFLAPGAPCEINIDGKTMERVHQELKQPTRFTFDAAAEHVYTLLLKKDCYPRFIRSEHYKNLLANGIQPSHKKRFFGFGPTKKKVSTTSAPNPSLLQQQPNQSSAVGCGALSRRRGSDRSLSGSAHELAISGVRDNSRVPHSHSQSNLSDIPYRGDMPCQNKRQIGPWNNLEPDPAPAAACGVCPWDESVSSTDADTQSRVKKPSIAVMPGASTSEDVCPWEATPAPDPPTVVNAADKNLEVRSRKNSAQMDSGSSSSDISLAIAEVSDRFRKSCGLAQQQTLDGDKRGQTRKLSTASCVEVRRASVSIPTKFSDSNRPSVSSFEELSSTASHGESVTINPSATDNNNEDQVLVTATSPVAAGHMPSCSSSNSSKVLKKSQSLRKACSMSGANAPTISVSSVIDDVIVDDEESVVADDDGDETLPFPLAPLAVPDSESPCSEWAPEIVLEEVVSSIPSLIATTADANVGDLPSTADAGAEQAMANPETSEENPGSNLEGKPNDICPWEDEETCKVDTPFVKTYATLGYL